jgi:hypothetical protein
MSATAQVLTIAQENDPVSLLRLKALVPQSKIDRPAVQLPLSRLKGRLAALPPRMSGTPPGDGPTKR